METENRKHIAQPEPKPVLAEVELESRKAVFPWGEDIEYKYRQCKFWDLDVNTDGLCIVCFNFC